MASILVDPIIADDEVCVRCIHHPLMYSVSKAKLKDEAFQPKWDERDASMLRLRYCNEDFCAVHGNGIEIKGNEFIGLATIIPTDVKAVNEWAVSEDSKIRYDGKEEKETNGMQAHIIYAPMNGKEYVDASKPVYTEGDISLPMHVDLRYDKALNDDVKTRIRHYARQLAARAAFIKKV